MGKAKYVSVRKSNCATHNGCKLPNYIPYNDLRYIIDNIDIGVVENVNPAFPDLRRIWFLVSSNPVTNI